MSARLSRICQSRYGATLLLLLLSGLTLFFGIWILPLVGSDEPRYAEVAREMWANSDYVSPRLAGRLWLEKAPLLYWGQAFFYSLFGVSEMSARLPSAFGALGIVLGLRAVARRALGERAAMYVAIVAATMGMMVAFAHGGSTDMPLCAMFAGVFLTLFMACTESGTLVKWLGWSALCGAFVAGAMLAKGLIGILFFVLIGGIWWAWARPDKREFSLSVRRPLGAKSVVVAIAMLCCALVASTWYLPVYLRHGDFFVQEFIVNQHFKRYTSNEYNHPQEPTFYLAILPLCALPWTPWLLGSALHFRALRPRLSQRDAFLALAWVWAILPIAFFSASGSKLPSYILPSFPAIAILAGEALSRGVWVPRRFKPRQIALGGSALMVTVVLGAFLIYAPRNEEKLSTRSLCRTVAAQMRPGELATFLGLSKEYHPVFYLQGRVVANPKPGKRDTFVAQTPADLLPLLRNPTGSVIVFSKNEDAAKLENNPAFRAELLGVHRKIRAYRIEK